MPADGLVGPRHVRERERAGRRDRAAVEHDRRIGGQLHPRFEHLPDRDLRRPVQHHAESALLGLVLHDQDDGPAEVGIPEHRSGDEQAARLGFRWHFVHVLIIGRDSRRPYPYRSGSWVATSATAAATDDVTSGWKTEGMM